MTFSPPSSTTAVRLARPLFRRLLLCWLRIRGLLVLFAIYLLFQISDTLASGRCSALPFFVSSALPSSFGVVQSLALLAVASGSGVQLPASAVSAFFAGHSSKLTWSHSPREASGHSLPGDRSIGQSHSLHSTGDSSSRFGFGRW